MVVDGQNRPCHLNETLAQQPLRDRIAVDDYWRVAHAMGTALPGWLVLVPRRHVAAISDLSEAEADGLGSWQVRLLPDLPADLVGPRIFTLLGVAAERQVPIEQVDALAHVLADELNHYSRPAVT